MILWAESKLRQLSLQSEEYLNHNVSDKIKKLVDTLVTFNTSSDVMMASFMVKRDLEPSAILDPPFLIFQMYPILLKTRRNGGNRDRKTDLCIKGCLRNKQKKNLHFVKSREKLRLLEIESKYLPLGHFKFMFSSQISR